MVTTRETVRWDIVDEHLDDAEYLLEPMLDAFDSATTTFTRLSRGLESRFLAHVDGLAVGGDAVAEQRLWPLLEPDAGTPERTAAACLALLVAPHPAALDRVISILRALEPGPTREGIVLALRLAPRHDVSARLLSACESGDDIARSALLPVVAARGGIVGAVATAWLKRAVRSLEPTDRLTALGVAQWCPRAVALALAEPALGDPDPAVQRLAMQVALVHGSPHAHAFALEVAAARRPADVDTVRACMTAVALGGEVTTVELLAARLVDAATRPSAIWALGFTGRLDAVPHLLPLLGDETLAGLAAEAIVGITGVRRDDTRYWVPTEAQPPVTDEDITGPVPADPDGAVLMPAEDLALPLPVAAWFEYAWAEAKPHVDARVRYGEGLALVSTGSYAEVLESTTMRRRHVVALELAVRTRGEFRIPTRGLSGQQRGHLAALTPSRSIDGARPYARIS